MQIVSCRGASGKHYQIDVDVIGSVYEDKPGVYIFSRLDKNGQWEALYVGETENLNSKLCRYLKLHPCLDCLRREQATHIGTLLVEDGAERLRIESDLRRSFTLRCKER